MEMGVVGVILPPFGVNVRVFAGAAAIVNVAESVSVLIIINPLVSSYTAASTVNVPGVVDTMNGFE